MTVLGWDASHYDGPLSRAILARAYAQGIRFFSHKIGEGLADTEITLDDTALAAARDVGIPFVGGYFVPRTLDSATQVAYWWGLLNAGEPWWRDFPGWFNQIDLERWPYDAVSAAKGIDCAKRWRDKTGRATILYASRSQYGDTLAAWDGPLWNADYRGGPSYPGDGWVRTSGGAVAGWAPYSGKTPVILQYTSSATIAGLGTCDANAFRGTLDQLAELLGSPAASDRRDPMPFLARAGNGQYYLCDGMRSQPMAAADAATLVYLATSPYGSALSLARSAGGTDNAEWGSVGNVHGVVRLGWTPAFGAVPVPASSVLTDAQVTAMADRVAVALEPHLGAPVADLRGKLVAALGAAGAALGA